MLGKWRPRPIEAVTRVGTTVGMTRTVAHRSDPARAITDLNRHPKFPSI